jgi:hypothetical protein
MVEIALCYTRPRWGARRAEPCENNAEYRFDEIIQFRLRCVRFAGLREAARDFIAFLRSPDAIATMRANGMFAD